MAYGRRRKPVAPKGKPLVPPPKPGEDPSPAPTGEKKYGQAAYGAKSSGYGV